MATLLLFSGCTSGPQAETSETKIEAQAKAIEQAAEAMVKEAVLEFKVTDTPKSEVPQESDGNTPKAIKPANQ